MIQIKNVINNMWMAPKVDKVKTNVSVSFKLSDHVQVVVNCQILKARSIKSDQLKLDDAHNCRVVALPKAFTSTKWRWVWKLIWTMTYLPDVSWPGIFISNDDFTAAFDLR